jgi:hypothetical protein
MVTSEQVNVPNLEGGMEAAYKPLAGNWKKKLEALDKQLEANVRGLAECCKNISLRNSLAGPHR